MHTTLQEHREATSQCKNYTIIKSNDHKIPPKSVDTNSPYSQTSTHTHRNRPTQSPTMIGAPYSISIKRTKNPRNPTNLNQEETYKTSYVDTQIDQDRKEKTLYKIMTKLGRSVITRQVQNLLRLIMSFLPYTYITWLMVWTSLSDDDDG